VVSLEDPILEEVIGATLYAQLREDIEVLDRWVLIIFSYAICHILLMGF
jgi:hypothetical protein